MSRYTVSGPDARQIGAVAAGVQAGLQSDRDVQHLREQSRTIAAIEMAKDDIRRGYGPGTDNRTLSAALAIHAGLPNPERHYGADVCNRAVDAHGYDFGLHRLTHIMATRAMGQPAPELKNDRPRVIKAAISTGEFGNVLADLTSKFLNVGFYGVEGAWRSITATVPTKDFRGVPGYSLSGTKYEQIPPGAEIPSTSLKLNEGEETGAVQTYGAALTVAREDFMNDDIGALSAAGKLLGIGGGRKVNELVFGLLMGALSTLFTTARGNRLEGATAGTDDTRLNTEGLGRAVKALMQQTDPSDNPLGLPPAAVLVPSALAVTAQALIASLAAPSAPYQMAASSLLDNANHSAASATGWILAADPAVLPLVELLSLGGRAEPNVEESHTADFGSLTVAIRAYHDIGVRLAHYQAAVYSTGAAAA